MRKKKKQSTAKRIWFGFLRFIAVCMCLGIIAVSIASVLLSMYVVKATANDDTLLDLENIAQSYTSIIYYKSTNAEGQDEWLEYQTLDSPDENRIWKDLDDISVNLQNAYIAIEDQDFREHKGVNFKRTVFAAINEIVHEVTGVWLRGSQQGASTINQQLVKNITDERASDGTAGYLRKIREIFRALSLDARYSKDMILEAYLNTLGLTGNIGGVEAGALRYFDKHAGDEDNIAEGKEPLTIAECATIAAITKNPTTYSPITNPEDHLVRRNKVISNMYEQGYITEEQRNEALAAPLVLAEKTTDENAAKQTNNSYFTDALIDEVITDLLAENPDNLPEEEWDRKAAENYFYTKGLKIYSTVVPELQAEMEDVFNRAEYWPAYEIEYDPGDGSEPYMTRTNASGVSINYKGELCAVVGGLGAKTADRTLNRAIDSVRQVGSTMKGVAAYPLAIEYGWADYSMTYIDAPVYEAGDMDDNGTVYKDPWPSNYSGTYTRQPVTVYEAIKQSLNTIAVRVGQSVGVDEMYSFATETLGITTLDPEYDKNLAPLVLGSMHYGMTAYELAGAYMMYGNGGQFTTLHSYTTVEDFRGNVILKKDITTVQAISEDTAYIMNRLLKGVLYDSGGTARGLMADDAGMESVGKTGTTNDNKDIWYVGLTPYYCSAFWFGYDESLPMSSYNPGRIKHPGASAWREIMDTVQADETKYPYKEWTMPDSVVKDSFCTVTGDKPAAGCPTATGYYKASEVDERTTCPGHGSTE